MSSQRPPWLNTNFTEPRVLVAIRDLCRPGAVVFDVGSNFGGLTMAMSRKVGPRGVVCAFEANPSIAARCQQSLVEAGCGNTQIYFSAVYKVSRERIKLYLSSNEVADSIYNQESERSISVPTLALDDFVEETGLVPDFVKMDIEGAEPDALLGFVRTIERHRPTMVLEQIPSDSRCLELLQSFGYQALDLSTYEPVNTMADLAPGTILTDILYAPAERLAESPYHPGQTEVARLSPDDFSGDGLLVQSRTVPLTPGRYLVHASFHADPVDQQEAFCGVSMVDHEDALMRHHGGAHGLANLARRWVFNAPAGEAAVFFQFARERPASFRINEIVISRVTAFDGLQPLVQ